MKNGYRFGLQKLLDIRKDMEEESKISFTESQRQSQILKEEIDELYNSSERYKQIKSDEDIVYQKIKRNYLIALQNIIKDKEKELIVREKEVEFRRNDLKQKQIDRKTVEILKEKQYSSYLKEQNRVEQINNDEFALYGYIRNLKGGE